MMKGFNRLFLYKNYLVYFFVNLFSLFLFKIKKNTQIILLPRFIEGKKIFLFVKFPLYDIFIEIFCMK